MTLARVRKRDGRGVPFDKDKITTAVRRAQDAVAETDPQFASEVADVVELALRRRFAAGEVQRAVPGIEDIQDLVEQALVELGRAPVAKVYILYRDKRARIREVLEVHEDAGTRSPARRPRVSEAEGVGRWSKGRIVAALMNEADVPRGLAEQVAAAVEARVFGSGLRRISTALIRELVDNELVGLGLENAIRRQAPVALGRHDLRGLWADPGLEPLLASSTGAPNGAGPVASSTARIGRRLEDGVGTSILRRFALEDVLDERAAELHLSGDLSIEDLGHPHLPLARAIPAELLGSTHATSHDLLGEIALALRGVAASLSIEGAAALVAPAGRRGRASAGEDDGLVGWLAALSALGRATARSVELVPRAPLAHAASGASESGVAGARRTRATIARLLVASAECCARSGATQPRLWVESEELAATLSEHPDAASAADLLLTEGGLVVTWAHDEVRVCGPGMVRERGERGVVECAAAVALNLPRLARRAGPWREERFLELAIDLVRDALAALTTLDRFRHQNAPARVASGTSLLGPAARTGWAVSPVGLREALRLLGDGEVRPAQGAHVLGVLGEEVARLAREHGLLGTLSSHFGGAARERFARQDAEHFQASQRLLFPRQGDERSRADGGATVAYSAGYDLAPPSATGFGYEPPGAAVGELCSTVASGSLVPPLALRSSRGADPTGEERPALAAWRRFEAARRVSSSARPPASTPDRSPELSFDSAASAPEPN